MQLCELLCRYVHCGGYWLLLVMFKGESELVLWNMSLEWRSVFQSTQRLQSWLPHTTINTACVYCTVYCIFLYIFSHHSFIYIYIHTQWLRKHHQVCWTASFIIKIDVLWGTITRIPEFLQVIAPISVGCHTSFYPTTAWSLGSIRCVNPPIMVLKPILKKINNLEPFLQEYIKCKMWEWWLRQLRF